MNAVSKMLACLGLVSALSASAQISLMPTNTPSSATTINLAWDPSPSTEVTGYYIYYGTNSGVYFGKLDVGNVTSACVSVAPRGTVYYFAVDAYDASSTESPFSNEITYSAPNLTNQVLLTLSPTGPVTYGSTNLLVTTGGSGVGAISFNILSGPAYLSGPSSNFLVTTGTGTVVVAAIKAGDDTYLANGVTNAILVTPAPQTIAFPSISSQKQTNVVNLVATASSGLPVSFAVQSGPGVLSGNKLSFTGGGSVVVVASQGGNGLYNAAANLSQTVSVSPVTWPSITASASSLAFTGQYGGSNPPSMSLTLNNTGELAINYAVSSAYSPNGAGWLSISSASGSVAAFGSAALTHSVSLTGLNAGIYYVTNTAKSAEATNGSVQWVVQVTVNRASQATLAFNPPSVLTYGTTNLLSTTGGSGTGAVSYQVLSGPGVINGGGSLVITAGTGQILLQATKAGDNNYSATNATASITASKASQSITFPAITAQKNNSAVALTASASSQLPVTFAVVAGPGVISGNQLKFSGTGTVLVSAAQPGSGNYLAATSVTNSVVVTSYLKGPSNVRVTIAGQ